MKKIIKSFSLNFFIFSLTLLVFGYIADNIYSAVLNKSEANFYQKWDCVQNTKTLINGFKPNCTGRWIKQYGTESFDIAFSTDAFGRRKVFDKISKTADDSGQALFFGGSDVLGQGVDDRDTLANQFLNLSDFKTVRNYGGHGVGPQQALQLLEFSDFRKEAPPDPDRNIFVFFFGDNHVDRAAGSWTIATSWGSDFPYYVLDKDDQLLDKGTFSTGKRFSSLQLLLKKSRLLDDIFSALDSYFIYSESNIRLTAKLLKALQQTIQAKYPNAQFYVVISPISTKSAPLLKKILSELNIDYLDYSHVWDPNDPANKIPESHPSALVYQQIAKQLAHDLKK